jgi:uncharacterized iron-regulated protein
MLLKAMRPWTSALIVNLTQRLLPALAVAVVLIHVGCSLTPIPAPKAVDRWQAWQVIESSTGRVVPFPEWVRTLEAQDILYFGEEHFNQHHIAAAIRLLSALMADGLHPAIGMEMFGWDGQPALDRYLSEPHEETTQFLEQAHWKTNWGGAFENYEPLVRYAKDQHLRLYAMNPPKALVRRVVKVGLAEAREGAEWREWRMDREEIVDDPAYRARLFDQLRRCHGGGTDRDYQTMYEASMVRDEGMAKTLVTALEALRREPAKSRPLVVSYTGGGHIQYNLPVPTRVWRRLSGDVRQATVYLASFDPARMEETRELLRDPIADYLWLTPVSSLGPVKRCR